MPRTSDTRQRMIESAGELIRERGVHGTSFADVLERSGAPRGSVYHHFKGGKAEIAVEALAREGDLVVTGAEAMLKEHDPVTAVGIFCEQWAGLLHSTDFAAGCSIVAGAVEGGHEPAARDVAGRVFADWDRTIANGLEQHGIPAGRAESLSMLLIASIEGAVVLSRGLRSLEPLDRVNHELGAVVAGALTDAATGKQ